MKTLKILGAAAAVAALVSFSNAADAAVIDFTSSTQFPSINAQPLTGSVHGRSFQVTSQPGGSVFGTDGINAGKCSGLSLACDRDGLGVSNDEIDGDRESITIEFSSLINVVEFYVLDLFTSRNGRNQEVGSYRTFDGTTWSNLIDFTADSNEVVNSGDIGFLAVAVNLPVKAIEWSYSGANDNVGVGDYAVAGLAVTPLPAAAWFLLTGLGGLAGMRWLRKDRAAEAA